MQNSFLAILLAMLISQNQSKEEELVKNAVFFATRRPSRKG